MYPENIIFAPIGILGHNVMDRKKIEEAVTSKIIEKDGKKFIPCPAALKIAETLKVTQSEVGKVCNDMKVKIMNCQLGCF